MINMTWKSILKNESERNPAITNTSKDDSYDYERTKRFLSANNQPDVVKGVKRLLHKIGNFFTEGEGGSFPYFMDKLFKELMKVRDEKDFTQQKKMLASLSSDIDKLIDYHKNSPHNYPRMVDNYMRRLPAKSRQTARGKGGGRTGEFRL